MENDQIFREDSLQEAHSASMDSDCYALVSMRHFTKRLIREAGLEAQADKMEMQTDGRQMDLPLPIWKKTNLGRDNQ